MQSKIIHGDCLEVLKRGTADSIDLMVTDPPYGYSFMGKDWDKAVPSVEIWKECLRVLKPGAFAFVMSAPRQDVLSQMIVRLTEAGFDTSFTSLYHSYASGFPKSLHVGRNVGKVIANLCNAIKSSSIAKIAEQNVRAPQVTSTAESTYIVVENVVISPSHSSIVVSAARWEGSQNASSLLLTITVPESALTEACEKMTSRIKDDEVSRTGLGKLKSLNEQDIAALSAELIEDWRLIISTRLKTDQTFGMTYPTANASATTVTITASTMEHLIGSTADTLAKKLGEETAHLDGSFGGFQPKPAVEIIIVAMKPLSEKTYVDQALANGHGVSWLDDCRVPTAEGLAGGSGRVGGFAGKTQENNGLSDFRVQGDDRGRFPANLIVSDDVLNDHSRFFSLDAWAENLPEHVRKVFPFLIVPKASKREKNEGLEGFEEKFSPTMGNGIGAVPHDPETAAGKKNTHATVKPLTLMSYLITLGSRPCDTVLDPFLGSGTTACAAKAIGRKFIGIEREEEYVKIAEARLAAVPGLKPEPKTAP